MDLRYLGKGVADAGNLVAELLLKGVMLDEEKKAREQSQQNFEKTFGLQQEQFQFTKDTTTKQLGIQAEQLNLQKRAAELDEKIKALTIEENRALANVLDFKSKIEQIEDPVMKIGMKTAYGVYENLMADLETDNVDVKEARATAAKLPTPLRERVGLAIQKKEARDQQKLLNQAQINATNQRAQENDPYYSGALNHYNSLGTAIEQVNDNIAKLEANADKVLEANGSAPLAVLLQDLESAKNNPKKYNKMLSQQNYQIALQTKERIDNQKALLNQMSKQRERLGQALAKQNPYLAEALKEPTIEQDVPIGLQKKQPTTQEVVVNKGKRDVIGGMPVDKSYKVSTPLHKMTPEISGSEAEQPEMEEPTPKPVARVISRESAEYQQMLEQVFNGLLNEISQGKRSPTDEMQLRRIAEQRLVAALEQKGFRIK